MFDEFNNSMYSCIRKTWRTVRADAGRRGADMLECAEQGACRGRRPAFQEPRRRLMVVARCRKRRRSRRRRSGSRPERRCGTRSAPGILRRPGPGVRGVGWVDRDEVRRLTRFPTVCRAQPSLSLRLKGLQGCRGADATVGTGARQAGPRFNWDSRPIAVILRMRRGVREIVTSAHRPTGGFGGNK